MLSLCFDVCGLLVVVVKTDEPTGGIWLFYYSKFWEKKGPFSSPTPFPHSHSLHVFLGRNMCQWKHIEGTLCPSAHGLWFSDASFGWYGFRNMEKTHNSDNGTEDFRVKPQPEAFLSNNSLTLLRSGN